MDPAIITTLTALAGVGIAVAALLQALGAARKNQLATIRLELDVLKDSVDELREQNDSLKEEREALSNKVDELETALDDERGKRGILQGRLEELVEENRKLHVYIQSIDLKVNGPGS